MARLRFLLCAVATAIVTAVPADAEVYRLGTHLPMARAAYNPGERAVVTYRGIPPFAETRDYVTRVLYYYDGSPNGLAGAPPAVYRTVGDDGTIIYTNTPPRGRR